MAADEEFYFMALVLSLGVAWLFYLAVRTRRKSTPLNGPPRRSILWYLRTHMRFSEENRNSLDHWIDEYGPVFHLPTISGSEIVLADPKALSHYYSKETIIYRKATYTRLAVEKMTGRGILWAEGEVHRRQRRIVTPAFGNSAIRDLIPVFLDSGYKVKTAWDALFDESSAGELIFDIQDWMSRVSLDTIGIAGFSHDFGSLSGNRMTIADIITSLSTVQHSAFSLVCFLLEPIFPILSRVPSPRSTLIQKLNDSMADILRDVAVRTRSAGDAEGEGGDNSIIGLLLKAGDDVSDTGCSQDEIMAQMKTFLLAGYETTASTMTWALIELSRYQDKQKRLRQELLTNFSSSDPTLDQLTTGLPYLDAVVHEILRLRPPLDQTWRVAMEDDVIPLGAPLTTADGDVVDRIVIAKGTQVTVPIACMNLSESIWGPDAKEFVPERWLDESSIPKKALEIQGHRHLLTFIDGPRKCIGRGFALAEIKAVLSILIRNYRFELRDGPETKIENKTSVLPRPAIAGEDGLKVPLRVRRVNEM